MNEHEDFRRPSRFELLLDLVRDRLFTIGIFLVAGGVIGILLGVDPSIPRRWKLAVFTGAAFVPVGYVLGSYITGVLYNPNQIYLVDLDAARIDGALFRFPYPDFRELSVTDEDGDPDAPYQMTQLTPNLYVAKNVDLEAMTAVGTWRGTLDDRELERSLQKVSECRGMLQDDAQRGFVLETSAFTIVRKAARETSLDVVEMFKTGSLPDDGAALNDSVDAALEQFNFQKELDDSIMEQVSSPEEAEGEGDRDGDGLDHQEQTNGADLEPEMVTDD